MPRIIVGNKGRRDIAGIRNIDYKYKYKDELDLKPGSELHDSIVDRIMELADFSHDEISPQFAKWNKIDDVLTAYIKPDEEEKKIKRGDPRKPTSIVFPYSYAILDALLTYMVMAFIREPIFKYEAVSGKDHIGGQLLEAVVAQHCRQSKVALQLHTLYRDSFAYGRGYAIPAWEVKKGKQSYVEKSETDVGTRPIRARKEVTLFEGNSLYPINPYLALPDPNVSAADAKSGEFFGWLETTNYMGLLNDEYSSDELFNVQYVRHVPDTTSKFLDPSATKANSGRDKGREHNNGLTMPLDIIGMYVNLIPADWKLGTSEQPEKWLFRVAADSVLVQADRVDFDHGEFPIISCAPDDDGRSPTPVSRLETIYGLQEVGDWLFNSHMTNVRKSINNMLIVDPTMINMNDLRDPAPGKLIRLRRPAWGRGVDNVVKQLKIDDITRGNIGETGFIQSAMQTASGTDASMMGTQRSGGPERVTKGEFQGTRSSAMNRLERVAMLIGLQCMQDLGTMFASNTQQFMTEATYVKIASGIEADLSKEIEVTNGKARIMYQDLLVNYDVIVRDGSIPGGNFSESWLQLYTIMANNPEVAAEFDMVNIFTYIARNLGAKNVDQFKKTQNPAVMPDEVVATEAAKGNLVPFGG